MPFAGILSLPFDVLDDIISYVAISEPDLLTLRCVNEALCGLITPMAFKEIVTSSHDREEYSGFSGIVGQHRHCQACKVPRPYRGYR